MAIGSEVVQGAIPVRCGITQGAYTTDFMLQNGREFDYLDILGNVVGSLAALGLCSAYHKRMLDRKRTARGYRSVGGDEELGEEDVEDVELEEGTSAQESGVTPVAPREATMEDDLDQWDENEQDWSDDEPITNGSPAAAKPPMDDLAISKKD